MFHRKNRLLLIEVLTLVAAGLIMIASSSVYWAEFKYHNPWYFVQRQALFAGLGLVAMNLTSRLNIQKLREKQKPILIGCYIALALVLIPGPVSYTHLDVYKRQICFRHRWNGGKSMKRQRWARLC